MPIGTARVRSTPPRVMVLRGPLPRLDLGADPGTQSQANGTLPFPLPHHQLQMLRRALGHCSAVALRIRRKMVGSAVLRNRNAEALSPRALEQDRKATKAATSPSLDVRSRNELQRDPLGVQGGSLPLLWSTRFSRSWLTTQAFLEPHGRGSDHAGRYPAPAVASAIGTDTI